MDFKDQIKQLGERVVRLKDQIQTEEATKNAFIMPFIQALGYDVFNPLEVVPEFTADIGIKKGEKVDYAIMKDGQPIILIECKWWGENLDVHNSQLFRYFHTTRSKFGLLTNGIQFRFYTDLMEANKMDEKPFLEFDFTNMKEQFVSELKKFHKSYFDLNSIVSSASELKYSNEIKGIMSNELNEPTPNFVKFFVRQVYSGQATEKVMTQFTEIVKKSLNQLISDIISDRLKGALEKENVKDAEKVKLEEEQSKEDENKVETTEEELEGFFIVKSILRTKFDSTRIYYRDFQNFFSVLLDDSIRQTICRLWFNGEKKFIGFIDENKKEIKFEISKLDDIYNYSEQLVKATERLIKGEKTKKSDEPLSNEIN
ncbi:MAG: type I restriction endonuclease [Bacteroidales bacterium]|nr:type I restriction endonuclease [Bacteroidales bacterium]